MRYKVVEVDWTGRLEDILNAYEAEYPGIEVVSFTYSPRKFPVLILRYRETERNDRAPNGS